MKRSFKKTTSWLFTVNHKDLRKFENKQEIGLRSKSSTLKNYKIIYQSYFNRSFQNTNFIQLVYYSSFYTFIFLSEDYPKNCENVIKLD